jgi:LAO/AO transport system kinase
MTSPENNFMSDNRPEWHESDHPSHSRVQPGAQSPAAFAPRAPAAASMPSVEELRAGIMRGDRMLLARGITLVESSLPAHRIQAQELLEALYPQSGRSVRVGITGVPGVGKSTFIEALGVRLCEHGRRLAVLTIDPSSELTGGSILGDKTRMEKLSGHPQAFVRPSPSRCALGGVARWTREAMILCEAAGYDTIFIETVGVGQSEVLVRGMTDCFLLLALAGAGDELQGIKKGIMELADLIAVTKADGDNAPRAQAARLQLERVLHFLPQLTEGWRPRALCTSSLSGEGIAELWGAIEQFVACVRVSGAFDRRRRAQLGHWLRSLLYEGARERIDSHPQLEDWLNRASTELPLNVAHSALEKLLGK